VIEESSLIIWINFAFNDGSIGLNLTPAKIALLLLYFLIFETLFTDFKVGFFIGLFGLLSSATAEVSFPWFFSFDLLLFCGLFSLLLLFCSLL